VNYSRTADKIIKLSEEMSNLSDTELKAKTNEFRERLQSGQTMDDILPEAFAVVRVAASRTLGMSHFKVQLQGGMALHDGKIAEMKTGEGKTLVATCPAYLNALDGKGVHIITVNDYLSKVNKEQMSKVFNFLGLTVSCITSDTPLADRASLYKCDIVYGTNKEFGFDYLRDNMVKANSQKMQRGHNYAIVDEADSVLIDEARTPLIISCPTNEKNDLYEKANMLAGHLERGEDKDSSFIENDTNCDFLVNGQKKSIQLTDRGVKAVEDFFKIDCLGDVENSAISHCVMQAIRANHLMEEGKDYIVKDDEVIIVDNFTGRLMDGRRFNDGLHQAIEAKEHVPIQEESKTFATITLQNYFRMYTKLSGMTGTAATEKEEFKKTYNMKVEVIPTNKPVIRIDYPDLIFQTEEDKFDAIARTVREKSEAGQPVLIGTSSIVQSEMLSKVLTKNKIKHQVLNAKQHEREAEIIAQAGKSGTITIATNMAGRGTDILLGGNPDFLAIRILLNKGYERSKVMLAASIFSTDDEEVLMIRESYKALYKAFQEETEKDHKRVVAAGGLCVIGTDRADNIRVDNQLRGRAGRQGDPGMSQFYISLEDRLIDLFSYLDDKSNLHSKSSAKKVRDAQRRVEAQHFEIRKNVLEYDDISDVQRKKFYSIRNNVIDMAEFRPFVMNICPLTAKRIIETTYDKDLNKQVESINEYLADFVGYKSARIEDVTKRNQLQDKISQVLYDSCDNKFLLLGDKGNDLTRSVVLSYMDKNWVEHLENIEAIKRITSLTGYGNIKPIDKFKEDAYKAFAQMFYNTEDDVLRGFLHIRFRSGHIVRDSLVSTVNITDPQKKEVQDLAHKLTMKCLEEGRMLKKEELDEEVQKLARKHAEETINSITGGLAIEEE
jgi:preprotein translocase subunit SecA